MSPQFSQSCRIGPVDNTVDCATEAGLGPCRAAGGAANDGVANRPVAVTLGVDKGDDPADLVVEVRNQNLRTRARRGKELLRPALGAHPAHRPPFRLRGQPMYPQSHRGGIRLVQDGCRPARTKLHGLPVGRLCLDLRRYRYPNI